MIKKILIAVLAVTIIIGLIGLGIKNYRPRKPVAYRKPPSDYILSDGMYRDTGTELIKMS